MLDVQFYGLNAGKHHATNVLLHILNALMLLWVLYEMTGALGRSAFVSAVFAVHPLHVESVAWVSERKDVLSCFFWILTMWAYAAYAEKPGMARYVSVVVLFLLGLLSKPMLVTLPFVLLLLDYWPLGRLAGKARSAKDNNIGATLPLSHLVVEKIPMLLISIASGIITFVAQKEGGTVSSLEIIPFAARVSNALVSYFEYLRKTVWPVSLSVSYPHLKIVHPFWLLGGATLFLAAACALSIMQIRRRPYLAVGWFWYLGTLLPVIGIIQVGSQAMADRYTYIPYIGLFVVIAWGVAEFAGKLRVPGRITGLAAAGVLLFLAIVTWNRLGYWQDNERLLLHTLEDGRISLPQRRRALCRVTYLRRWTS
jgi:hypothetical protein